MKKRNKYWNKIEKNGYKEIKRENREYETNDQYKNKYPKENKIRKFFENISDKEEKSEESCLESSCSSNLQSSTSSTNTTIYTKNSSKDINSKKPFPYDVWNI